MPRLLFYVLLVTLVVLWARRFMRAGAGGSNANGGSRADKQRPSRGRTRGVPALLVCGACGAQYEPQASGWICPKCGK